MSLIPRKCNMGCSKAKAHRARKGAHEEVNNMFKEQFLMLYDYCEELKRSNLGSTVKMQV